VRRRPCSSVAGASGKPAPDWVYLIWVTTARSFSESSRLLRSLRGSLASRWCGHASIQITMDRYGHLMPGNEEEAAGLLDAYLARAQAG
jgi:integrase